MRRFNYAPVMCIAMMGMVVEAMDSRGGRPSFVGIKKRHPVVQSGEQDNTAKTGTNEGADAPPSDQGDLQRTLLGTTDDPLPWTVAQKVTLGAGVAVVAVVLAVGSYLLYEKFHPAKQDDGRQDQQPTEQGEAHNGNTTGPLP